MINLFFNTLKLLGVVFKLSTVYFLNIYLIRLHVFKGCVREWLFMD